MKRKGKKDKYLLKLLSSIPSDCKVAIISDLLTTWGGAEETVKAIYEIFPDATIYTSVVDREVISQFMPDAKIIPSIVQYFPFEKQLRKEFSIAYPFAFKLFNLKKYDVVISVSSAFAKCVNVKKSKHITICLTPPIFLYKEERRSNVKNKRATYTIIYEKIFKKPLHAIFKYIDKKAINNAIKIIANSNVVRRRIKEIYNLESDLIFPPIEVEKIHYNPDFKSREKWYLFHNRLEIYKGAEHAIRACVELKRPLKVSGAGSDMERLQGIVKELNAKGLVKFLGRTTDEQKFDLMYRCKAMLYPVKDEDFGIIPVEANASGGIVIAHRSGGPVESLSEDNPKTAVFYNDYTWEGLKNAILEFENNEYNAESCRKQSLQFSKKIFQYKLINVIKDVTQNT